MLTYPVRVALIVLLVSGLTACVSDRMVTLRYAPDPGVARLTGAQALTVFRFADHRGDEGDRNPLRAGGIYGTSGSRVAKVLTASPWPDTLAQDLTAGFAAREVEAVARADQEYVPGTSPVSTPLALSGEIRNFSSEMRWTIQAHVSGIIRLYDQRGTLLLEKQISARIPRDASAAHLLPAKSGRDILETYLNGAVEVFVRNVVTDPDLTRLLVANH